MGDNKVKVILKVPQNVLAEVEVVQDDRIAPFEDREDTMVINLGESDNDVEGQAMEKLSGDPPRLMCGQY